MANVEVMGYDVQQSAMIRKIISIIERIKTSAEVINN